jgi:hypothetical protein
LSDIGKANKAKIFAYFTGASADSRKISECRHNVAAVKFSWKERGQRREYERRATLSRTARLVATIAANAPFATMQ